MHKRTYRVVLLAVLVVMAAAGILVRSKWSRISLHLVRMPDSRQYALKEEFIKAAVQYHVAQWLLAHSDKDPREYTWVPGVMQMPDGNWHATTGVGHVAGPGLIVVVDNQGHLVTVSEYFSPE